jgi:hypothetical protein
MTPEQLRNSPEQADMDGPLFEWRKKGIRLAAEGREKVRGVDAYRLRVTLPSGVVRFLDLEASSFRKLRWQGELGEGQGRRLVESVFLDYRKVGGLMFPLRIESGSGGKINQVIAFEKIDVNPVIEDSRFEMPR